MHACTHTQLWLVGNEDAAGARSGVTTGASADAPTGVRGAEQRRVTSTPATTPAAPAATTAARPVPGNAVSGAPT
jgi:hypothetical protein